MSGAAVGWRRVTTWLGSREAVTLQCERCCEAEAVHRVAVNPQHVAEELGSWVGLVENWGPNIGRGPARAPCVSG